MYLTISCETLKRSLAMISIPNYSLCLDNPISLTVRERFPNDVVSVCDNRMVLTQGNRQRVLHLPPEALAFDTAYCDLMILMRKTSEIAKHRAMVEAATNTLFARLPLYIELPGFDPAVNGRSFY